MKTSELTGARLDWATARATHKTVRLMRDGGFGIPFGTWYVVTDEGHLYCPTVHGGVAFKLLDNWITTLRSPRDGYWWAHAGNHLGEGSTPAEAICRAIVAAKLGDDVELPGELL